MFASVWHTSLSMDISSPQMQWFFLLWLRSTPLSICAASPLCFPLLKGISVVSMSWSLWIVLQWTLGSCIFSNNNLLWIYAEAGLLDQMVALLFVILRSIHTVLHSGCTSLHSHPLCRKVIKIQTGILPEKTYRWLKTALKDVQHH